jgi:peptide/nickel transport system ATP-binding protein/glutathione transport system ATP-binding protein
MLDQTNGTAPLLSIENLRVEFQGESGPIVGVKDVSFHVQPGETVCVVGESGSGKSVTSLSLLRLVEFGGGKIVSGKLWFRPEGKEAIDVASLPADRMIDLRGDQIGMIFQEPMTALNPVFTIGRQLTDGLRRHRGLSASEAEARALELLQEVRLPEPARRLKQYPHELSGGMRQRVVIAMAMACRPQLLIADEPTTALDVTIQAEILGLIKRLKREFGMAVLFITHDMAVVAQLADRVVVMRHGELVEEGPVERIFAEPQAGYTKALLASVPKLGEMRGKPGPEPLRIPGQPEPVAPEAAPEQAGTGRPVLKVDGLTTRFPVRGGVLRRVVSNVHAVENVSFELAHAETLALVGESGCGKSTTARSILRLVEPTSGDVIMDGQDILGLNPGGLRRARRNMQMVFQDPFASLNPFMRLRKQVAEPMMNFDIAKGSELEDRIAFLFDRVGLPRDFMRRFPHELSGGQRQRVAIARALSVNPKLIIADEAVSALDVSVQAQVLNLLMELQADFGISYLFISHDMAVVERVSHRVGVMYLGRIVEIGSRADIFEDPRHSYTQTLLSGVPIADPTRRTLKESLEFKPLPSPVFPVGHEPEGPVYEEVSPGHFVLQNE